MFKLYTGCSVTIWGHTAL